MKAQEPTSKRIKTKIPITNISISVDPQCGNSVFTETMFAEWHQFKTNMSFAHSLAKKRFIIILSGLGPKTY